MSKRLNMFLMALIMLMTFISINTPVYARADDDPYCAELCGGNNECWVYCCSEFCGDLYDPCTMPMSFEHCVRTCLGLG